MKYAVLIFLTLAALAQTGGEKFSMCGDANSAPCTCLRRTNRIQQEDTEKCRREGGSAEKCMSIQRDHCEIVDIYANASEYESGEAPMPDRCSHFCKRGDCRCGIDSSREGVCHIMHKAADHEQGKKK